MRIKLRVRSAFEALDGKKYLIYVDTNQKRIVAEVEDHIKKVLEVDRVQLLDEDCIIPSKESSGIFVDDHVYTCRVLNTEPLKRPREKTKQQQSKQPRKCNVEPRKIVESKKRRVASSSSSSSSSSGSLLGDVNLLPSSSSESDGERKVNLKKRKKSPQTRPAARMEVEVPKATQSASLRKPTKVQQPKQQKKKVSESGSDTPPSKVVPQKRAQVEEPRKVPVFVRAKELASTSNSEKPRNPIAKKVLEVDSDSDSSKEAPKPAVVMHPVQAQPIPKANIPISVRKQQFKAQHQTFEPLKSRSLEPTQVQPRIEAISQQQPKKPIVYVTKSLFPESNEWREISVKILEKSRKDHKKSFLLVDQKIMFQTTELDQQKFVPKMSDWKTAEVELVAEATEDIVLVTQPRREKLRMCEYNILGLKIKEEGLSDFQKRMVREITLFGDESAIRKQSEDTLQNGEAAKPEQTPRPDQTKPTETAPPPKPPVRQQTPLKDLVLSQVDFYFSDRSYNRDNYLISHAALHPELCTQSLTIDVSIDVVQNFPKIKRMNLAREQFISYLREEPSPSASYEIHPTEDLLRKKGLRIDPPKVLESPNPS